MIFEEIIGLQTCVNFSNERKNKKVCRKWFEVKYAKTDIKGFYTKHFNPKVSKLKIT